MNKNITQGTSNLSNKVFDRIDVASEAGRVLANQGAKKTQDLLEAGIDKVNQFQGLSSKQYAKCTGALSRCLTEKPVHSAFVIAGIGALLALWLTSSSESPPP